jgi:hypothetical protein
MSTKNLARSVIEGGRTGFSKYLRRHSLQILRFRNRALCRALLRDPEAWETATVPRRPTDYDDIAFADRTNPCDRFLASRDGRPWNDVYSEICRRFDRRTMAGRHVTEDHLLASVETSRTFIWGRSAPRTRFYVDRHGYFRHNPTERY